MSNWLLSDARAKEEEEIEKDRNLQSRMQRKRFFIYLFFFPVFIFVLKNQVSVFVDKIRDHSLPYPISHKKLLSISHHFYSFLKKIFVLFFIPHPCVFPSSLVKWAGTLLLTVRCAVTWADREWCWEGFWRIFASKLENVLQLGLDFGHFVSVISKQ